MAEAFLEPLESNQKDAFETGLKHECGVFAAIGGSQWPKNNSEIAQIICIGLEALQHR